MFAIGSLASSGPTPRRLPRYAYSHVAPTGSTSVPTPLGGSDRAEVEHGQQREDERLDGTDEQVEELPDGGRRPEDVRREQRDQRNHDHAGEDVAEESQGQRDRPRDLLDEVDREQPPVRLRQVPVVPAEALLAYAGDVHPDDDEQGQRVREVHVRGGWRQELGFMDRGKYR